MTDDAGTYSDAIGSLIDQTKRLAKAEAEVTRLRAVEERAKRLIDQWDGEVGAQEDYRHSAAVRAVEACIRDLTAALADYDHPGCCTCCDGAGYDNGCMGMCWDCRGTGHPHEPGPKPATTEAGMCACPPCPGRGSDGHGMTHCAECCFGSGVIADEDCPKHCRAALAAPQPTTPDLADARARADAEEAQ